MTDDTASKSALQDNIEKKGKNAYYFAHAHKANGPKWDGKQEPKLLSKQTSSSLEEGTKKQCSFDYQKSNITSYAFCNNEKTVKLYLELEGVGDKCTNDNGHVELESSPSSLSLVVYNYKDQPQCLRFAKLAGLIDKATYKVKPDRIIVTLTKQTPGEEWLTMTDKATPDEDAV